MSSVDIANSAEDFKKPQQLLLRVNICTDVWSSNESDRSQLNPSTFSLHWQRPVWTSHSCVLPAGLQEHGLWREKEESLDTAIPEVTGYWVLQVGGLRHLYLHPASESEWYPGWHLSHLSPITPGLQLHLPVLSHWVLREPADANQTNGYNTTKKKHLWQHVAHYIFVKHWSA